MTVGLAPSERLALIRNALASQGAGALLVVAGSSADPDMAPFVGSRHIGSSWLLVTEQTATFAYATPMEREEAGRTGLPLATPEALGLAALAERFGRDSPGFWARWVEAGLAASDWRGPIALAGHPAAGAVLEITRLLLAEGRAVDAGHSLVRAVRRRKDDDELAEIARVTRVVGEAFADVAAILSAAIERNGTLDWGGAPLSVGVLRGRIGERFARHGLEQPKGNIVAPGRDGGVAHNPGNPSSLIRPRESLVVDLFPRGALFSDATRTFCWGEPPEPLKAAHADVLAALTGATASTRAGAVGWDLQRQVCEAFSRRGHRTLLDDPNLSTGYVHGLGHGVGLELHEDPSFRAGAGALGVLAERDVVTLEPGLYDPSADGFGVRIEDLVVVREDGCEVLTPWPRGLDPRAWASQTSQLGGADRRSA